jgi:Ca2+-binding RTX toxin-like protein
MTAAIKSTREIVFLDPGVPGLHDLLAGVAAGRQVHVLDRVGDSLARIAEVLTSCGSIDAVHIVTHGAPGALHFAAGTVTQAALDAHRCSLERIGEALAPDAELLLWACDVGRGAEGERFLAALGAATGADVAASTHPVGSAAQGGRWTLDRSTGAIAAGAPFTVAARASYPDVLALPDLDVVRDDTALTGEDAGPTTVLVLENDGPVPTTLAIVGATDGAHGTVSIDYNGTGDSADDFVVYTPNADFNGIDTFTYTATGFDFAGALVLETATVTVTVNAVADIVPDSVTVGRGSGANNLALLANDTFGDPDRSITAVGAASHGSAVINNNGTPGSTADDFVVYTPTAGYSGPDAFTYRVASGGTTETATVSVTVSTGADVNDDAVTIGEDAGPTNILVLGNDDFGATPAITATTNGADGTVSINNNGTTGDTADDFVVYTPNADFDGTDSFTYTVISGGVTETGIVSVTVVPPLSQAPSSGNDSLTGTDGAETIAGQDGDDVVHAVGASNLLYGNQGSDTIDGENGNNTIVGGQDSSDAADLINAGSGDDLIWGNGGADTIAADGGANTVVGGFGGDLIATGALNDMIFGNQDSDTILAGDGANLVFGGLGNDTVVTGSGTDTIWGNEGNDTLAGGNGADRYVFASASGSDQINGFAVADGDRLDLQGQTFTQGTASDGDVLLTLAGGGTIELNGIAPAGFSPGFVL